MRPFKVPCKATTVRDRLRYFAAAQGLRLHELGQAVGIKHENNARRIFYNKIFWPRYINPIAEFLKLDESERKLLHLLAAREAGYDV